jgi:hypothetical protein
MSIGHGGAPLRGNSNASTTADAAITATNTAEIFL